MKTRAQIYSHEASGILRDISTYGILTQKQILGLYPQKDEQIKNLLSYLCKQKRLFLVDGFYSLTPELPKDRDRGLEAAVSILADFMEQVEYHAAGEYPVKIIFLAGGEVYEILYAEPGKEAILNLLLARPEQEPPMRLVILEDAEQVALLAIPNVRAYRPTGAAAFKAEESKMSDTVLQIMQPTNPVEPPYQYMMIDGCKVKVNYLPKPSAPSAGKVLDRIHEILLASRLKK